MAQSRPILLSLFAALTLFAVTACEQQPAPQAAAPQHDAATTGPELAGAWYQIYFDTGSAKINDRGNMIVGKVAYVVANDPTARVTVIGRTDRIGAPPANMALSQQRANAVRDALVGAGVPAARIDTSWTGEPAQGAAANDAANSRNRVVDVTVVKQPG